MKVALFGADGKVGLVLVAALASEGHEVTPVEVGDEVPLAGHDAIVDFTQPDAVAGNVLAAVEQGVPAVVGRPGSGPSSWSGSMRRRRSGGCRSSSPRTSRSARS